MDTRFGQLDAHVRPLHVDEYVKLAELGFFEGERVELIRGRVVRMAPMGLEHAGTIQRMNTMLVRLFGDHAAVRPQLPMLVSNDTMPEPDFAIVDPLAPDVISERGHTWLAIEIAQTSLRIDRQVKAALYAQARVPEFWIVNLVHHRLEVFRSPRGQQYRSKKTLGPGEVIRPLRFPDVAVQVSLLLGRSAH